MSDPIPGVPTPARLAPLTAQVFLRATIPGADEQRLLDALTGCGLTANVRVVPAVRGAATLTWIVLLALPMQGFALTLGTKAAEDAYARLRAVLRRMADHHHELASEPPASSPPVSKQASLILQDTATSIQFVLEPGLPDDAYQQLTILDISRLRGPLHYDRAQSRWQPEPDQASPRT